MQAAVITFPGSNCDRDMLTAIHSITKVKPYSLWHAETELPNNLDLIVLPGGFSYGDYLRSGAIAARSPIMQEVIKAAQKGLYVLGVCNGFQILTETGLLPGTLMRNKKLKFIGKTINLKVENSDTAFTKNYKNKSVISVPIAHQDGNYFIDQESLKSLNDNNQIAFRYCSKDGIVNDESNPNGAIENIAGVFNSNKRILGMMPHPERACDPLTIGMDGSYLFQSLLEQIGK